MADPVLKFPGEQAAPPAEAAAKRKPLSGHLNRSRRLILLVIIPLIVAVIGLTIYLSGGRYMTTDNAYVGSQKVLVTPDISGKISKVVKNAAGLFQEVEVTPHVDFARLSEVLVVVAPPPAPDPDGVGRKPLAPSRGLSSYR